MLIDSHCHLHLMKNQEPTLDLGDVLATAREHGVYHALCVGTDFLDLQEILAITEMFPMVSASVGLHPTEAIDIEPCIEDIVSLGSHPQIIAIGETGLDYYRENSAIVKQKERFRTHIQAARILKKPLIIHTRSAQIDTIKILQEEGAEQVGGVMHCFTEDFEMAKKALDLNFYISFSGILSFRNAVVLRDVVRKIPLDRILIETDAPYLAPVPFRGKMNQPAYVKHVAEIVAELHCQPFQKICDVTTDNFLNLFKVKLSV